jgi:hypothetical protein
MDQGTDFCCGKKWPAFFSMIMSLRDGTVYSACFKIAATDRQGRESIMLDMSRFDFE